MYREFLRYIEKERLFAGRKRLLLAISGGVDSVVLSHLMWRYGQQHDVAVDWVHCNFHLRGDESERDEAFVRSWAEQLGCRLFVRSFDTLAYVREKKVSVEMAARELRYAYFAERMQAESLDACLLAHHADDNVETFFINLFRGSGLKGLRGMQPCSASRSHVYLRPLLFARRADILKYAKENSIAFVEDSTNREEFYLRNRIRLSLLPVLESVGPGAVRKMTQSMETLRAADSLVDDWFRMQKETLVRYPAEDLDRAFLAKLGLNPVLRDRIPSRQEYLDRGGLARLGRHEALFWELYLREKAFNRSQISQILANGELGTSGAFFENSDNSGILLREQSGWRWIALEESPSACGNASRRESRLFSDSFSIAREQDFPASPVPGLFKGLEGPVFRTEVKTLFAKSDLDPGPERAYLNYDKLHFPLYWRHWMAGDRFKPLGMKGFKKLSDFFSDLKLSRLEKEQVWLLCSGQDIVWVAGYRIDERYKLEFPVGNPVEAAPSGNPVLPFPRKALLVCLEQENIVV